MQLRYEILFNLIFRDQKENLPTSFTYYKQQFTAYKMRRDAISVPEVGSAEEKEEG